jgi:hypothetical protein
MVALLLYVYIHTPESEKSIFNIFSVWSRVYPDKPLWKINTKSLKCQAKSLEITEN